MAVMHPANAASEKLRASKPTHQPKSGLRLAANPAGSREAARARRRGDRIRKFAAMRMSAFGTKLTKAGSKSRSAAGSCVLIVGGSTGGGWQRPLDSERFKMGARKALIRKRFYKKRDVKNSLIQGVARETRRGKPPGAFCSSSRSAGTCARASAFNASSGLAGLLRDGHYYQQGVSHESPRHQYGRRRRAVRPHIRAGIGNANEQSRRRSERPRARPKRAVSPPPLPVPIGA